MSSIISRTVSVVVLATCILSGAMTLSHPSRSSKLPSIASVDSAMPVAASLRDQVEATAQSKARAGMSGVG